MKKQSQILQMIIINCQRNVINNLKYENEKKNLKIYVFDEDHESELNIENEKDFIEQQVINKKLIYLLILLNQKEIVTKY